MAASMTIAALILIAALVYSSVGQAGATAYLAVLALAGVAPASVRPSALLLNVLVASVTLAQFHRARAVPWMMVAPFVFASVPAAFIGGSLSLPGSTYRQVVGLVLLFSAYRLLLQPPVGHEPTSPPRAAALGVGLGIGLISGLTGMGGGVLLGPLLLTKGWADARAAAGAATALNLMNSLAALGGGFRSLRFLPPSFPLWAAAAFGGSLVGSHLGARKLGGTTMRRLLALILAIAGLRLVVG